MFRKDTWDLLIIWGVNMSPSLTAAPLLLEEYMRNHAAISKSNKAGGDILRRPQEEKVGGIRRLREESAGEGYRRGRRLQEETEGGGSSTC